MALHIQDQIFAAATQVTGSMVDPDGERSCFDGMLGLSFQGNSVGGTPSPPPLISAWEDGLLDKPIFTVRLNTDVSNSKNVRQLCYERLNLADMYGKET